MKFLTLCVWTRDTSRDGRNYGCRELKVGQWPVFWLHLGEKKLAFHGQSAHLDLRNALQLSTLFCNVTQWIATCPRRARVWSWLGDWSPRIGTGPSAGVNSLSRECGIHCKTSVHDYQIPSTCVHDSPYHGTHIIENFAHKSACNGATSIMILYTRYIY